MRRLWYLFVLILATVIGLPASVVQAHFTDRPPLGLDDRLLSLLQCDDRPGPACVWAFGNNIPGRTVSDFGQINQYGPLLRLTYLLFGGLRATTSRLNDFRDIVSGNPCTA
jgi:hypothetical protein